MALLKEENSAFSNLCLQRMQANSMLSMKLALKMLRNARNLDYKGCMMMEINVGLNKIMDKDFDLGVSEILFKPSRMDQSNPGFETDIPDSLVASYFAPSKFASSLELGVVENAQLPYRFYYEKHSDQVRLWLNEKSTDQPDVRNLFDFELKEALRQTGIDIRDRALTMEGARKALY